MRVQTRPRVQVASLDDIDSIDLEAIKLAHEWGVDGEILLVPVRPCEWQACGGTVMTFGGDRRCILCCRSPGWPLPPLSLNGKRRREPGV